MKTILLVEDDAALRVNPKYAHLKQTAKENRKAYRENCLYPLRIVKGRERIETAQLGA